MTPYKRTDTNGNTEYSDGDYWFDERYVCHHCSEEREEAGLPFRWAEERNSFGCYAGRYCDECWPKSGFRDARDPTVRFDPLDAGECLEAEDY
jgi:hypothetical protein